ncbi:MAG: purine-nucleoside phosphorylase [Verrucomicrobiota bacterium]
MQDALEYLQNQFENFSPEAGIILGSGLGFFADESIENPQSIPYEDIPNFPRSTVEGHKGQFVYGTLSGKSVLCMQGRFHYYEGYKMDQVVMPVRIMALLGVKQLFVTNAAGGINTTFKPGTLMALSDHINGLGTNPLIGPNHDNLGTRFPDMSEVYSKRLRKLAAEASEDLPIHYAEGVYLAVTGPSYETPAEINAFRTFGADAVGMSTVPEAIVANHAGIEVCGISCITNLAAGMSDQPLTHDEVKETADRVRTSFATLLSRVVSNA